MRGKTVKPITKGSKKKALTVHNMGQWNKDERVRSKKKRVRKTARKKQRKNKEGKKKSEKTRVQKGMHQ